MFRCFSPAVKRDSFCTVGTVEVLYFLPLSGSQGPWVLQSSEHVCTQMFSKQQMARGRGVKIGGRGRRRRDKGKTKGNGRGVRSPHGDGALHVRADQAEGPNRVCRLVIWGPFVCQADQSLLKRRRNPFTFSECSNLYWQVAGDGRTRGGFCKPSTCCDSSLFSFPAKHLSKCASICSLFVGSVFKISEIILNLRNVKR